MFVVVCGALDYESSGSSLHCPLTMLSLMAIVMELRNNDCINNGALMHGCL